MHWALSGSSPSTLLCICVLVCVWRERESSRHMRKTKRGQISSLVTLPVTFWLGPELSRDTSEHFIRSALSLRRGPSPHQHERFTGVQIPSLSSQLVPTAHFIKVRYPVSGTTVSAAHRVNPLWLYIQTQAAFLTQELEGMCV